eukprot:gene11950-25036_t
MTEANSFDINATGGSFPEAVYTNQPLLTNLKTEDSLICTDQCTLSTCGFDSKSTPRPDWNIRHPLVDFAGSDSLLNKNDYKAFPDLQILPAMAGAAVYNVHELTGMPNALVLSRTTIADIYLGSIRLWNDTRILKDNTESVRQFLSGLSKEIKVVVRGDVSGTTDIFNSALGSFGLATGFIPLKPLLYLDLHPTGAAN